MRKKIILKGICIFIFIILLFNTLSAFNEFSNVNNSVIRDKGIIETNEVENKNEQDREVSQESQTNKKLGKVRSFSNSCTFNNLIVDKKMSFVNCSIIIEGNITIQPQGSLTFNMCQVFFNLSSEDINTVKTWNLSTHFISIYGNLTIINTVLKLKKIDYSNFSKIAHIFEFNTYENSSLEINNSTLDFLVSEDELDTYAIINIMSFYKRASIQAHGADIKLINNTIYNYYAFLYLSNSSARVENNIVKSEKAFATASFYFEFNLVAKLIEIQGNGSYYFFHNLFNSFNLHNCNIMTRSIFILDLNQIDNITFEENIFNTGRYYAYTFVNITGVHYLKLLNNIFLHIPFLVWNTQELSGLWQGNLFALTTSQYETFIEFDQSPKYKKFTLQKNNFIDIDEDFSLPPNVISSFLKTKDRGKLLYKQTNEQTNFQQNDDSWFNYFSPSLLHNPVDTDGDGYYDFLFTSKNYASLASVSPFKMIKNVNLIDNVNLSVSNIEHCPANPRKPAGFDYTKITITANVTGADLELVLLSVTTTLFGIVSVPMVKVDNTLYSYTLYYYVINYTDSLVPYTIKTYDVYGNVYVSETHNINFYVPNNITTSKTMYCEIVFIFAIILLSSRKRIKNN
ncbi:MAG: hypothetical protein K9W45_12820 [Candidatus Heimdallarchaeum aukensis]|uniref:Uncharacterized protein n=1 Tax=Candidatus Heimdallarchaeum aukensis TaxID=2876573 RepID=A0A9Y1BKH4_9ARCH|nr:MAG: hypothetical protein K9W45_12820 [Candidatus Heimdallarchaeum aukensis]